MKLTGDVWMLIGMLLFNLPQCHFSFVDFFLFYFVFIPARARAIRARACKSRLQASTAQFATHLIIVKKLKKKRDETTQRSHFLFRFIRLKTAESQRKGQIKGNGIIRFTCFFQPLHFLTLPSRSPNSFKFPVTLTD